MDAMTIHDHAQKSSLLQCYLPYKVNSHPGIFFAS